MSEEIYFREYKADENGREMCRILEDANLLRPLYAKIFPALHAEIKDQYSSAENHWYYLSEEAHDQYMQHRYGFVTYANRRK